MRWERERERLETFRNGWEVTVIYKIKKYEAQADNLYQRSMDANIWYLSLFLKEQMTHAKIQSDNNIFGSQDNIHAITSDSKGDKNNVAPKRKQTR